MANITSGLPAWLLNPILISSQLSKTTPGSETSDNQRQEVPETHGGPIQFLPPSIQKNLSYNSLFPVQKMLLSLLYGPHYRQETARLSSSSERKKRIRALFEGQSEDYPSRHYEQRDYCVSAPTGSGKTLAYALPILSHLSSRLVTRLRALIVLPTKELAAQVKAVFDHLARGTGLRILCVTGGQSVSFAQEHTKLQRHGVDILIATPGRLIDHLNMESTPLSLDHLQYLVLDEADRLMNQSYQNWLELVLACHRKDVAGAQALQPDTVLDFLHSSSLLSTPCGDSGCSDSSTWWKEQGFLVDEYGLPLSAPNHSHFHGKLTKLLFSATLSKNPEKLAALQLNRPVYITVDTEGGKADGAETSSSTPQTSIKFTAPEKLQEFYAVCNSPGDKPLLLLHVLMRAEGIGRKVLIFTKSVVATHRLQQLLEYTFFCLVKEHEEGDGSSTPPPFQPESIKAISSNLSITSKNKLLADFQAASHGVLICSDGLARGIDLGESVELVINYDVPALHAYVHRIGRTARADHAGKAITLLTHAQVRHFKQQVKGTIYRPVFGKVFALQGVDEEKVKSEYLYLYLAALNYLDARVQERARQQQQEHRGNNKKRKVEDSQQEPVASLDRLKANFSQPGSLDFEEMKREAASVLRRRALEVASSATSVDPMNVVTSASVQVERVAEASELWSPADANGINMVLKECLGTPCSGTMKSNTIRQCDGKKHPKITQILMRLAFLGPLGSYSHQATLIICSKLGLDIGLHSPSLPDGKVTKEDQSQGITLDPCPTIASVLDLVLSQLVSKSGDEIIMGMVPFENSTCGSVGQTLDYLTRLFITSTPGPQSLSGLYIHFQVHLPVNHCLLMQKNASLDQITTVYSHPEALGQCAKWLNQHFPLAARVPTASTAAAASLVATSNDPRSAAIASALCLDLYDPLLRLVCEGIADLPTNNTTRFLLVSQHPPEDLYGSIPSPLTPGFQHLVSQKAYHFHQRILLAFQLNHQRPGALCNVLTIFGRQGINITRIESRPSRLTPWEYIFFVELDAAHGEGGRMTSGQVDGKKSAMSEDGLSALLGELADFTSRVCYFGSYSRID